MPVVDAEKFTEFEFLALVFIRWLQSSVNEFESARKSDHILSNHDNDRINVMRMILDRLSDNLNKLVYQGEEHGALMEIAAHVEHIIYKPIIDDIYKMLPDNIKFGARFGQTILTPDILNQTGSSVYKYPAVLELLRYMFFPCNLDLSRTPIAVVISMVKDIITYIFRQILSRDPRNNNFKNWEVFKSVIFLAIDLEELSLEDLRDGNIEDAFQLDVYRIINSIKGNVAAAAREHLIDVCTKLQLDLNIKEIKGHLDYLNIIARNSEQ